MKKLLMFIPLVFLLCFTFSCQDKEAMAEVEEQNKELIYKVIDMVNKENFEELNEVFSEDCVIHNPGGRDISGIEAIIKEGVEGAKIFSDFKQTITDMIAEEDKIAYRLTLTSTHVGELRGIKPTGKKITLTGMDFCRISEGKIVEMWTEHDTLVIMKQLGMELIPKDEILKRMMDVDFIVGLK